MTMANDHSNDKYYVPHSSPWPVFGSLSLFVLMLGAAMTVEQSGGGGTILAVGFLLLFVLFYGWFGKVVAEHQAGMFNMAVDRSFRMGMSWFIFSEVMFFAAFFGALFYARQFALPWLSGHGAKHLTSSLLWHGFEGGWPIERPERARPEGRWLDVRNDSGDGSAPAQHADSAHLGRDGDDCSPRAQGR
jgi:cytochrome c oxidase subunit 3